MRAQPGLHPLRPRGGHNPRVTGTEPPVDPRSEHAASDVQIRTFLIADVRGYTLFTQERGDEAAAKLAAKFADMVREVVEARGGILLELRGDEALCVFSSAREAIRTAVDLQQRFVEETLEQPELPLTVGIGLDAGEAVEVQGGYRGGALNLAARLCGQARAGEILTSREVTHLARRIDGVRYEDRGSLTFKGISDPVAVARVVPEGADPMERLQPFAPAPPPPSRSRRRWKVAVPILLVLALVAIAIPLLSSDDGGAEVDIGTNSVARMNAEDGSLEFATELGERPGASAIGFGSLWVAQPDRGVVTRLDLQDGSINDTIRVGTSPVRGRGRRGLGLGDQRRRRHREPDQRRHERGQPDAPRRFGTDGDRGRRRCAVDRRLDRRRADPPGSQHRGDRGDPARGAAVERRLHAGRRLGLDRPQQRGPDRPRRSRRRVHPARGERADRRGRRLRLDLGREPPRCHGDASRSLHGRRPGDDPRRPGTERARRSERLALGRERVRRRDRRDRPGREHGHEHRAGGGSRGIARERRGRPLAGRRVPPPPSTAAGP